jgi:hypothetical protein
MQDSLNTLRRFYGACSLWCFHNKLNAFMLSASHHAVIRVYDEAGNVIETHEHAGDFKEW